MRTSKKLLSAALTLAAAALLSGVALAADPGLPYPPSSEASDQKAGSVLFYNVYSSNAVSTASHDTRINITNTSTSSPAFVHLFFVDGTTCSVADSFICLTANQTASFLASDVDPGVNGYIVAVASDGFTGCPTSFNFLIGDEYVKYSTGHQANLGAIAFAALYTGRLPGCDETSFTATLNFNGVQYNRAPRVLALSNVGSRADGNDTLLIVNRFGGNLATGAGTIGSVFGLLFDDAENSGSFTFTANVCQIQATLSNSFPRSVPRFESLIPAGRSGWLKFWSTADNALLGAAINNNDGDGEGGGHPGDSFRGGHNLHHLTLTASAFYVVPVFPPTC
jgi:hypothetical protein